MFLQSHSQTQRQSYHENGSKCGDKDLNLLSVTGCSIAFAAMVGGFLCVVDSVGVLTREQRIST